MSDLEPGWLQRQVDSTREDIALLGGLEPYQQVKHARKREAYIKELEGKLAAKSDQPDECTETTMQKELVLTLSNIPPEGIRIMEPHKYPSIHIIPGAPMRESVTQDHPLYKALWSLRHAMQVDLHRRQETIQLFYNDDYRDFDCAKVNWERDALKHLKRCLDQADRALTEIEDEASQ